MGHTCYLAFSGERACAYGWFECGGIHRSRPNGYEFELGDARKIKSAPDFIKIREEILSIIYGEEIEE